MIIQEHDISPVQNYNNQNIGMQASTLCKFLLPSFRLVANQNPICFSYSSLFSTPTLLNRFSTSKNTASFSTSVGEAHVQTQPRSFSEFVTDKNILDKLQKNGITKMFPVQQQTFQLILDGFDILASDRTGSGKTLSYTLPVLQKFNKAKLYQKTRQEVKFLILCPTRELVIQVTNEIKKVNSGYKVVSVYGGASIEYQTNDLKRGATIVVATPGRLLDLIERKSIQLKALEVVCIDEADTMLQKGFKDDVEEIFKNVREAAGKTQNIMFSATVPFWVGNIAKKYFSNMKRIDLVKDSEIKTSETVQHYGIHIHHSDRHTAINNLIERFNPDSRTIIFTKTKVEANDFLALFDKKNIAILHGDISQQEREINLNQFRSGQKKILIATDVAARGIDIPDVELVIQLTPPEQPQQYIHRSGRTGRAGKSGVNITFFDHTNINNLIEIESFANISISIISTNYNMSVWQSQVKKQLGKAEKYHIIDKKDEFYKGLAAQIIKNSNPEVVLTYFLKEKIGPIPETKSILNNKKNYLTYVAYPKEENADLKATFKQVPIENITIEQDCIKFDVPTMNFHLMQKVINEQSLFQVQILDENQKKTLSNYFQGSGSKIFGGKGSTRSQNDKRNSYGSGKGQRLDKPDRKYGDDNRKSDRRSFRNEERLVIPQGQRGKLFLYGYLEEIHEDELRDILSTEHGILPSQYSLKLIKKNVEGQVKRFGFIQFEDRQDCIKFYQAKIEINGEIIKKKLSKSI